MASTQAPALQSVQRLRSTLRGAEDTIFDLVCSRTTLKQWVQWMQTPLEHAIATGNVDLLAKLQTAGARANSVHSAVRGGQEALVDELLRQGASPSEPDENDDAPLHVAVQVGHGNILSMLLRQGADVDGLDKQGCSPLHLASGAKDAGSLDLMQRLVSAGADLSLRHGEDGKSALDWAAFHGRVDLMRSLIQHGVDVHDASDKTDFTALHVGASNNQVGAINTLVEAGAGVDAGKRETPLHVATKLGRSDAVVSLLRHGAVVDELDVDECPALHLAVKGGNVAAVQALLAAGAKPDLRGRGDESTALLGLPADLQARLAAVAKVRGGESTALGLAVKGEHVDIVTALAQHGANVNAANKDGGSTALHVATSNNSVAVIDALIAAGADVDAGRQETPLHVATKLGLPEATAALLRHGADPEKLARFGDSVLHIAASTSGNAAIVEALLAAGAKPNLRGRLLSTALGVAAENGHVGVVKALIQHGASLNAPGPRGRTPLHVAASKNKLQVIEILLAAGARVDVRGEDGKTPLHVASAGGYRTEFPEAIAALMRYGAGSIAFDTKGQAPLHLAIEEGHANATAALLEAGADVNLRTKDGQPALCEAAYWGRVDVLKVLIQHGADVKATGGEGRTALHEAALGEEAEAIDALVVAGADLEAEDDEGMTPLLCASSCGSSHAFSALLKHGANAAKLDAEGRGVIHKVAGANGFEGWALTEILASGADPNLRDIMGCTPLHLCNPHHPGVLEDLLEHGADIDARDWSNSTALHRMAVSPPFGDDSAPAVEVLVSWDAATDAINDKGRTPLHVASAEGNLPAMRALLRSGANLHAVDNSGRSPLHLVVFRDARYDIARAAKGVDLLLRWGADETATAKPPDSGYHGFIDDSDDDGDDTSGLTAAELWERNVTAHHVSDAGAASVRKLLADAQKDRTWRRRGWLVLVRAFPDRVRLKAHNSCSRAITRRARSVRARGVAAAASEGAPAGAAPLRGRAVRGLSGVVAGVVTSEEEGVFRNVVKFL